MFLSTRKPAGTEKHCNTLQHTVTHRNTPQHTGTRWHCNYNKLHHPWTNTLSYCNTLQHTATHCNTLQHTAKHLNLPALQVPSSTLCTTVHHTRTLGSATTAHCCTLPHPRTRRQWKSPATRYYIQLLHTPTHCNTLQHARSRLRCKSPATRLFISCTCQKTLYIVDW